MTKTESKQMVIPRETPKSNPISNMVAKPAVYKNGAPMKTMAPPIPPIPLKK